MATGKCRQAEASMQQAVLEIMSDVGDTVAEEQTPLKAVWQTMREQRIEHVPVLKDDVLVGMVSSWDIARAAMEGDKPIDALCAGDVMERALERLHPKSTIDEAAKLLAGGHFHSLPVVDSEERLVGILTTTDLLRVSAEALAA
jgi:CBS domain-containing protein